jgi:hypothetical protein
METAKHCKEGQANGTKVEIDNTGPATLKMLYVLNETAAVAYFQVYFRKADDVTVGTTVPHLSFGLPASAAFSLPIPPNGIRVGGNGLTVASTTTRENSTGANTAYNVAWN